MPREIKFREIFDQPTPRNMNEAVDATFDRTQKAIDWITQRTTKGARERESRNQGLKRLLGQGDVGELMDNFGHEHIVEMKEGVSKALELLKHQGISGHLEKGLVPSPLSRRKNIIPIIPNILLAFPVLLPPATAKEVYHKMTPEGFIGLMAYAAVTSYSVIKRNPIGTANSRFIKSLQEEGLRVRKSISIMNFIRKPLPGERIAENKAVLSRTIANGEKLISVLNEYEGKFKSIDDRITDLHIDFATQSKDVELEFERLKKSGKTPVQKTYLASGLSQRADELSQTYDRQFAQLHSERKTLISDFSAALNRHYETLKASSK